MTIKSTTIHEFEVEKFKSPQIQVALDLVTVQSYDSSEKGVLRARFKVLTVTSLQSYIKVLVLGNMAAFMPV